MTQRFGRAFLFILLLLLAAAPTAVAGSKDVRATTSDTVPGGGAYLFNTGSHEALRVCDLQNDAHSAWAYVSYGKKYENSVGATGKVGSCRTRNILAAEGRTIYVRVCLRDRDAERRGPENKFCSPWVRGTA